MKIVLCCTPGAVLKELRIGLEIWKARVGILQVNEESVVCETAELILPVDLADARTQFTPLVKQLEAWMDEGELTIIVQPVRPLHLNPLKDKGPENVLAMLILAFPEIRWLFGTTCGYQAGTGDGAGMVNSRLHKFRQTHGLHTLFAPDQCALFDSAGLRDWVRQRAVDDKNTKDDAAYLPKRTQLAIALDEETPYSHLHAYTAYRFGFRAAAVNSATLADHLLGNGSTTAAPALVFEDIYVNFADGGRGLSWLEVNPKYNKGRSNHWPGLANAEHRIFVTSGQRLGGDDLKWQRNEAYLARQRAEGKHIEMLFKPYAGIFRLWDDARLFYKLRWLDSTGRVHRGVAPGFVWPPPKSSFTNEEHGHSSPGVMLVIAESLIERAEKLLEDGIHSVPEAVRGAVLANDALEILGGRTPTIAVEALRLKHHFEVLAECQFAGVEHQIHLAERMKEIRRDVGTISQWFGRPRQELAKLNAEMFILSDLVRVFRKFNQFDEEQILMDRVRELHNTLWMREQPWRSVFKPILRYSEFLLASFPRFCIALACWVVGLSAVFHGLNLFELSNTKADSTHPWGMAISAFFGAEPLIAANLPWVVATSVAVVSGLAHLAIFISHLYTLVSRK